MVRRLLPRSASLAAAATAAAFATAALSSPDPAWGAFAASVPTGGYTMGNVFTANNVAYNDPTRVLGAPNRIVDEGFFYQAAVNPLAGHYQPTELTAIGRGGSITLQYAQPVTLGVGPDVGVSTNVTLADVNLDAVVDSPAKTFAFHEYGAERTAVVEVAGPDGLFASLGRVVFDDPTNGYTNTQFSWQDPNAFQGIPSDFTKPFTAAAADFGGMTFTETIGFMNGSGGGTWIDVPAELGLTQISFVRLSDTMWRTSDGQLHETRTSSADASFIKPADLFIDAVVVVPEPGSAAGIALVVSAALLRRRRRHDVDVTT